jgi:RHS repeat-associated protein
LTYDNNGNLTSITDANGTTIYSWNARNQLAAITGPNVNASFVYDGLGRRENKTINNNLTEFLYDGVNPVQETSGATVLANLLTGLGIDEFFTRTDVAGGTTSHFLPHALGSVLALADSAGTVQTEYTYEPFGRTSTAGASNTNPFQYTGRENDGTELYYYRARYYHSELQRFVSQDPIKFRGGDPNLYGYVSNNPIGNTDPFGLIKYTRALCSLIDKNPDKNCMCTWRCYCPRGYILGNMSSVIKAPCDEPPQVTCFKPEPSDYALVILIMIMSSLDGPLPFGDAIGVGIGAGAFAR